MTLLALSLAVLLTIVVVQWLRSRRRAAEALAESNVALRRSNATLQRETHQRAKLETIIDQLNEGIIVTGPDLKVQYSSRKVLTLLPEVTTLEGKSLIEATRRHEISELARAVWEEKLPKMIHLELPIVPERILLVEASILPAEAGSGIRLSLLDVTERIQTEHIRRDIVANASHDLRTPLTLITGYTETLLDGVVEEPTAARRCLEVVDKHCKRILRIVEDMLTVSRLEGESPRLRMEPFDLKECVDGVLEQLRPIIESREPQITLYFPPNGLVIEGDRFYWDQIFTNLLENALKENARPGLELQVSAELRDDNTCEIVISDDGIGIPARDLPYVFKRFYRGLRHHSQNEVKGTGLGLSIVRRAVAAHGGTIKLRSTPGVETVFTLQVPIRASVEMDLN